MKELIKANGISGASIVRRSIKVRLHPGVGRIVTSGELQNPEYIDRPSLKNVERLWVIINRSDVRETNENFLRSIAADDEIRKKALVATVADESKLIDLFKWVLNEQRAHSFHGTTLEYVYHFTSLPLLSDTSKISELIQPPEPPEKPIEGSSFDNWRWQY